MLAHARTDLRFGQGEHLRRTVVVDADHLGDTDHVPDRPWLLLRIERVERVVQVTRRGLGVIRHLMRQAVVVVEGHDVDDVDDRVCSTALRRRCTLVGSIPATFVGMV